MKRTRIGGVATDRLTYGVSVPSKTCRPDTVMAGPSRAICAAYLGCTSPEIAEVVPGLRM